jgi:hypothetical protein
MSWLKSLALVSVLLAAAACVQRKPEIRVSSSLVKSGDMVLMTGTSFTPNRFAMSHLLKPDGTEYNPLRLRVDGNGEFVHKIDTVMLDIGAFELWVEDEASKVLSNRVRFTVE